MLPQFFDAPNPFDQFISSLNRFDPLRQSFPWLDRRRFNTSITIPISMLPLHSFICRLPIYLHSMPHEPMNASYQSSSKTETEALEDSPTHTLKHWKGLIPANTAHSSSTEQHRAQHRRQQRGTKRRQHRAERHWLILLGNKKQKTKPLVLVPQVCSYVMFVRATGTLEKEVVPVPIDARTSTFFKFRVNLESQVRNLGILVLI